MLVSPAMRWAAALLLVGALVSACSLLVDTSGLAEPGGVDVPSSEAGAPADGGLADATDARQVADSETGAGSAYRDSVLSDRPLAYWPFDDATGSPGAVDLVSGKTSFGTGTITFGGAGAAGTSLTVDGGGAVVVGDLFDFAGAAAYSLEAWIKPDVAGGEFYDFFSKRSGPQNGYVFYVRKNADGTTTAQFEHLSASGARGASRLLKLRSWQHVVVTFDPAAGIRLYVDGLSSPGYSDVGAAPQDSTVPLQLGGGLLGSLDEVAIYDRALTPERIAAHSALGRR